MSIHLVQGKRNGHEARGLGMIGTTTNKTTVLLTVEEMESATKKAAPYRLQDLAIQLNAGAVVEEQNHPMKQLAQPTWPVYPPHQTIGSATWLGMAIAARDAPPRLALGNWTRERRLGRD